MYLKEIQDLYKLIPKEHRKTVDKIISISHTQGAKEVLEIVKDLSNIPANDVHRYGVWHEDNLDGG